MVIDSSFWREKKVFLTGHTGFKGAWLSLWLQLLGAKVTGYSLEPPTNPNLFEVAHVGDGMVSIINDVRDHDRLKTAILENESEIIIHMAAQSLVRSSYKDPVETYSTNVMGTVNILDAARSAPANKVVLIITTDKCYENKNWAYGYREVDRLGGNDPYSNSKACAELVTSAYRASFFSGEASPAIATARAGNVIGGGDWAEDRLIPDCIKTFFAKRPVKIRNPDAVRPWQHVLEPLSGYLALVEAMYMNGSHYSDAYNFGPREESAVEVRQVVGKLAQYFGEGARMDIDESDHPHEEKYLKLDCSKSADELGWRPRLGLDTALEMTYKWYVAYHGADDMKETTCRQIDYFSGEKGNSI